MPPLHPAFVHFPIALVTFSFVADYYIHILGGRLHSLPLVLRLVPSDLHTITSPLSKSNSNSKALLNSDIQSGIITKVVGLWGMTLSFAGLAIVSFHNSALGFGIGNGNIANDVGGMRWSDIVLVQGKNEIKSLFLGVFVFIVVIVLGVSPFILSLLSY